MPVVEYSLYWWKCCSDKEIYFLRIIGNGSFQCLQAMIDGLPLQEIVFQDLVGPLAEAGTIE